MNKRTKTALRRWCLYGWTLAKWTMAASAIGVVCGLIGTMFHFGVHEVTAFRGTHPWVLYLLPLAGFVIVSFYKLTETDGLGTDDIIDAVHEGKRLPILLLPAIFFGTVLTHLCGGSAGREGAALQMGGTIGQCMGRTFRLDDRDLRVATLAGMAAGLVTGLLQTACGIPAILAGILTQLGLYSINMAIMGMKATVAINVTTNEMLDKLLVSLRFVTDVAKGARPFWRHPIFVGGLFTLAIIALLYWFFGTELGCSLRATGANANMARAQGINTNFAKVLGLVVSNGLVALSGALLAQYNSASEINMGRGAIVIGLAAVIIGEAVFGRIFHNFALKMVSVSLGAIIYYIVIQLVLTLGFDANLLKLLSASVVAVFLAVPYWKGKYFSKPVKKAKEDAKNA
mgnify:CR=1 FL=1